MRFLVITKARHLIPPEASVQLMDRMGTWRSKYSANLEQIWGFAGMQGGGGILTVDSLEELNAVMSEFPMMPISDVEIIPLIDLDRAMETARHAMAAGAPVG